MEHDRFHVPYLSDKIPEAVFHGQAVKTVAYLRVSTALGTPEGPEPEKRPVRAFMLSQRVPTPNALW